MQRLQQDEVFLRSIGVKPTVIRPTQWRRRLAPRRSVYDFGPMLMLWTSIGGMAFGIGCLLAVVLERLGR